MTEGASQSEVAAMRRALELACRPERAPTPNPRVGCVILDPAGRIAGEGWHERAGGPHAEVVALAAAGAAARGGTAVVTLEPCAHTGRTGPCTVALVDAGVRRVVVALADPHPVASGGADALRSHGIEVVVGVLADEAATVNADWTLAVTRERPVVTWKAAASLDGRVAAPDGSSRWISCEESRAEVHQLRAAVDAVLVGTGTALADDPGLTARGLGAVRQPVRVVMGMRDLPPDARLLDGTAETLHLRTRDPAAALALLHERGIRTVLLEGGPTLAGSFLQAGLIDRVRWYAAPLILGAGRSAVDAGITTLSDGWILMVDDVGRVGTDVRIDGRPARNP